MATGLLVEQGAKAAVAYLNEYQNGLEGHKIKLYICENQGTPSGGIVKKYLPKVSPNPNVSSNQAGGVAPVLALAGIKMGSTAPVTPAGIKAQTETAKNVEIPLSGGLTFTCNGTAIPLLKSVCSSSAAIGIIQSGRAARSRTSRSTTRRRCSR